jgi:prophage maintenance system killer protein
MALNNDIIIYQAPNGALELQGDLEQETIWANLQQISDLFSTDKSGISRHLKNIYSSGELHEEGTVANFATVQNEGNRKVERTIEYYNLDAILSVGYRVNSKKATEFRKWATQTLRKHIIEGYTINKSRIHSNYKQFMLAVSQVQELLPEGNKIQTHDALELIKIFASTWISLTAYDSSALPTEGATLRDVDVTAEELYASLALFKTELKKEEEATDLFGIERERNSLSGIVGNVFQSFGEQDLYPSVEAKAVHLLYFIVKNHPFVDGNKRSGAYAFIWFLQKYGLLQKQISPQALTALTILVAESNPTDKDKIVGLILLLLQKS